MLTYIAVDQWRNIHQLYTQHPRKELLHNFGRQHALKMYCDPHAEHIGWIIAGHWLRVYRVSALHKEVTP